MSLNTWVGSNLSYAKKLADLGWEGARQGEEDYLAGEPLAPFLSNSARKALRHATAGLCIGIAGACLGKRRHRSGRALVCGLAGGVIGFGAGFAWRTRHLAENMARTAINSTGAVRDERWLQRHPINYA